MAGTRADPALAREDDGQRLLDNRALDLRALGGLDERPALVAVFLRVLGELLHYQLLQLLVVAEQRLQLLAIGLQRLPLVVELYPIQPGELPEAQVDDVLGLALGELVFPAQRLLRRGLVFARADELDDVVDLRVREQAPEDDLDALLHSVEPELRAPAHGDDAEFA